MQSIDRAADSSQGQRDTRPVFGYVRVSSEAQEVARQKRSLPEAHTRLPEGLSENGLELFCDRKSGWSGVVRPGYESMLARIQRGEASAVLVDTSSRLTRQGIREALSIFFTLEDARTRLFTTEGREYRFDLGGIISLIVDAEGDQRYSQKLSHNIASGKAAKAASGRWHHGAVVPGYRNDRGELSATDDLPVMGEAFRLFAVERLTYARICSYLDAALSEDTLARFKSGGVTRDRLRSWLAHPIYAGFIVRRGERTPGTHRAAVSVELFEAAQRRLRDNVTQFVRPARSWAFAGVARCATCGHAMRLHPVKNRQGVRYTYVVCAGSGCPERHHLPIAAAFEANIVAGLVGIGFALDAVLATEADFGISTEEGLTVDEASQRLEQAQQRVRKLGGLIADDAMGEDDPKYVTALEGRDAAQAILGGITGTATSYRDELRAVADKILSLTETSIPFDDDVTVYDGERELMPEHAIARGILGWQQADFDTRRSIIQRTLESVSYSRESAEYRFRVGLPVSIATPCSIESKRGLELKALEVEGWGDPNMRVYSVTPSLYLARDSANTRKPLLQAVARAAGAAEKQLRAVNFDAPYVEQDRARFEAYVAARERAS